MPTLETKTTRQRLLEAAMNLFYQQGVTGTTLAHIAGASGVPLGNVYYHFRTKDALIEAVIDARRQEVLTDLEQLEQHLTPLERLRALLHDSQTSRDVLTAHGCPYASLAQRLRDEENHLADEVGDLLRRYLEFVEVQFVALNVASPQDAAEELMVRLYGALTLANAMNSPDFLERQLWRLEDWLLTQSLPQQAL